MVPPITLHPRENSRPLCVINQPVALVALFLGGILAGAGPLAADEFAARDAFMGDYAGGWVNPVKGTQGANNPTVSARVINLDEGRYRIRIFHDFDQRLPDYFDGEARVKEGRLEASGKGFSFTVEGGKISGTALGFGQKDKPAAFALKKVERLSPTLGLAPPADAVVLLGKDGLGAWEHGDGKPIRWKWRAEEQAMEIDPESRIEGADRRVVSKEKFGDVRVHAEFRYPIEPAKEGQGRGNSGFFLMDFYEVQILNSYGLEGYWNECGSIYKTAAPMVNMAAPPLQWQTYDIEFRAPRFDASGKKVENARITVRHNGVLIHHDREIPHNPANREIDRSAPEPREPGPIQLQDHNNRIQFRNIWAVRLD